MNLINKTVLFSAAGLLAAGVFSAAAHAQLLNGSFEQGGNPGQSNSTQTFSDGSTGLPGWTVITDARSGQVSWDSNGAFGVPVAAGAGSYYLDITGNNDETIGSYSGPSQTLYTSGGVYQTFATTAGDKYSVSYLLGTDSFYNSSSTPGIEAFVGGVAPTDYSSLDLANPTSESGLASSHPQTRGVWTTEDFDFVASGSSTTLTLIGYSALPIGDNQYIGLDDVVVTDLGSQRQGVPDAGQTAMLLSLGLGAVAGIRRKRAAR
jgi:hypothetical protein